jgi:hypothetical protein
MPAAFPADSITNVARRFDPQSTSDAQIEVRAKSLASSPLAEASVL